ncbi:MAG TPA: SUMF1/EgtB/PvdO family nonheme iron enzyme [Pyrinomonadaceae bacterium]|nr:SUMF1/EgtB/PvdO family nonheme iron enzyme [Pyrinomonadaceae bacterium]
MPDTPAAQIAREMESARAATLRLFDLVPDERVLHRSPGFGFRPIIWHLAHIGVFEGYWLLQKLRGEPPADARYERVFDPIATPREESKNLPTRREMEDYLTSVRRRALDALAEARLDSANPLLTDAYVFRLVIEHERQHQETLLYLLQMLDPSQKRRPTAAATFVEDEVHADTASDREAQEEMLSVPAGAFELGASGRAFAYDNEQPAHEVFVREFRIDRLPATNAEFAAFVAEGGYERREFWSEEGWTWRMKEGWTHPLYWRRDGVCGAGGDVEGWTEQTMFETRPLAPRHPVTGISWYEAEAYARFRGKRLPTEAEWERAVAWDEARRTRRRYAWGDAAPDGARCNFDALFWGTTPVGSFPAGASATGCLDATGNVWEWTADPFDGFPGFEPFPYPEYSQTWFDGDHRVLKGGSWATGASVLRASFRNFFRRQFRIAFAGVRCAADACPPAR